MNNEEVNLTNDAYSLHRILKSYQLKDIKNGKHSHIGNNYWNRFDFRWSS